MERVESGDDHRLRRIEFGGRVLASELDRGFIRLSSRIAKEGAIGARRLDEAFRQIALLRDVVEVRNVVHALDLRLHGGDKPFVRMTKAAGRDARSKIEVALAVRVEQFAALAVRDDEREPPVRAHHHLILRARAQAG